MPFSFSLSPNLSRQPLKCLAIGVFAVFCVVGLCAGGIAAWLTAPDLQPRMEHLISHSLGRKVTLGKLQIQWGNPLVISISDLHVGNAAWGSEPYMMRFGHITAELDPASLLVGRIQYRQLIIDDFDMLLERDARGVGNWRFDNQPRPTHQSPPSGGIALIPKNRTQFPVLIHMQLHHGMVRLRTSSGKILRIAASDFIMGADGYNQPVHLLWHGAYNDIPAHLNADMQPYAILRDGTAPYGTHVMIDLPKSNLDFTGTMMNPLDADGLDGTLKIQTSQLGEVLQMMGMQQPSSLPLIAAGPFKRDGDHWRWHNTQDILANNNLQGDLALDEGARAHPDTIDFNLSAGKFDLKTIWDGLAAGPKMQFDTFKDITNLFLNLHLAAQEFLYGSLHLSDPDMHLSIQPNEVALNPSTLRFAGGKTTLAGKIAANETNLQFDASVNVSRGNMAQFAAWLGAEPGLIAGDFNMNADLNMSGAILDTALKNNSHGDMVFTMNQGVIAKNLLEKASTDLRALVRRNDGDVTLQCMIGIMTLRNGVGTINPLRLSAPQDRLTGIGQADFIHQSINIIMKSDAKTTGFFALDIPLRISGPFSNIGIMPALSSSLLGTAPDKSLILENLSIASQKLAVQSYCLQ